MKQLAASAMSQLAKMAEKYLAAVQQLNSSSSSKN